MSRPRIVDMDTWEDPRRGRLRGGAAHGDGDHLRLHFETPAGGRAEVLVSLADLAALGRNCLVNKSGRSRSGGHVARVEVRPTGRDQH